MVACSTDKDTKLAEGSAEQMGVQHTEGTKHWCRVPRAWRTSYMLGCSTAMKNVMHAVSFYIDHDHDAPRSADGLQHS